MEKRTKERRTHGVFRTTYNSAGSIIAPTGDVNRTLTWENYVTTGPNYRNWKERIKNGMQATTSLDAFRRTLYVSPSGYYNACYTSSTAGGRIITGTCAILDASFVSSVGVNAFDAALKAKAINQGRQNFTKSYRRAATQWQSGTFVGELAETVRFLKSPLKSLEKRTIDLGKGLKQLQQKLAYAKKRESRYLRVATDSWLAYQYGAKPLVNDIHDAHQALKKLQEKQEFQIVPLIGTGEAGKTSTVTAIGNAMPNGVTASHCTDIFRSWLLTARYKGAFKSGANGHSREWDSLGLAPDNWAPTAWEIIPWSFVADYFSNAGAVIDTASFQLVSLRWMSESLRQQYTNRVGNQYINKLAAVAQRDFHAGYGGGVVDTSTVVQRRVATNDYIPSLSFHLPGQKQGLNLAALANSIESLKMPKWPSRKR